MVKIFCDKCGAAIDSASPTYEIKISGLSVWLGPGSRTTSSGDKQAAEICFACMKQIVASGEPARCGPRLRIGEDDSKPVGGDASC